LEQLQNIKQRFGIIGNNNQLNLALQKAIRVAPTDISVLVSGESGVGKEVIPKIIHGLSHRKHAKYIAVNCGAIPEGTIDSELFGHEKGAFTGALADRKGYFQEADNGTIFLDEIGELPISTQVRLLRVLETGEFIKVGSSKVIKTNVRVVAASNINIPQAIESGKFREDLFYRLNTVPIHMLPLRERAGDIHLLFRKFARDFAEKYRMPPVYLDEKAQVLLSNYRWPGNVRQLKNITEQISIIEKERNVNADILQNYLPANLSKNLPAIFSKSGDEGSFSTEREILYKVLFDMKRDMTDLKKLVLEIMENKDAPISGDHANVIRNLYNDEDGSFIPKENSAQKNIHIEPVNKNSIQDTEEYVEESLSLEDKEIELIKKALDKHNGKRKYAAQELGISERTLYRKIKEYEIKG